MPDTSALARALTIFVLAVPFLAVLVLLLRLLRPKTPGHRNAEVTAERAERDAPPPEAPGPLAALPVASYAKDEEPQAPPPEQLPAAILDASSSAPVVEPPSLEAEDDMFRHIGPIPDPKTPSELHNDIQRAERAGNHALLARLCLDLAEADPADPQVPEVLRKCVRAAMRSKSFAIHAAARLELAERARAAGDLTTACEHWQIARGLFFDMNDRELHKKAEGLMLRHGCPTDWVLTDF